MKLFHGTNRKIRNLRTESFLSEDIEDAIHYAENKNGCFVYEFDTQEPNIYRDNGSDKRWWISYNKLNPIKTHIINR